MNRKVLFAMCCSSSLLLTPLAQSAETAGKTMIAKGSVLANDKTSDRKLRRRKPIFDVDTVTTSDKSKAQFRMNDGSMVALQENSKLIVEEYQYVPGEEGNSMVLELVEGGLRSVTGAIKNANGSYKLKTPVGSIGIRGTHFEIEIVEGDMFLAVWDGAIDLTVDAGAGEGDTVSFGEGEDFSFGVVSEEGEVTQLLEAPENFNEGHSEGTETSGEGASEESSSEDSESEDDTGTSQQQGTGGDSSQQGTTTGGTSSETSSEEEEQGSTSTDTDPQLGLDGDEDTSGNSDDPIAGEDTETDIGEDNTGGTNTGSDEDVTDIIDEQNELQQITEDVTTATFPTLPDFIAQRSGSFTYSNLVDSSITSSSGDASNFQISMTVDFDTTLTEGQLSLTDSGGDWFAAFNGAISANALVLGVNFVSHGDVFGNGDFGNTVFTNEGNGISGSFNLTDDNGASAGGSFLIE